MVRALSISVSIKSYKSYGDTCNICPQCNATDDRLGGHKGLVIKYLAYGDGADNRRDGGGHRATKVLLRTLVMQRYKGEKQNNGLSGGYMVKHLGR